MSDMGGSAISSPLKAPGYLLMAMSVLWGTLMVVMTILTNAGNLVLSIVLCLYYLTIAGGAFSMARGGSRTVARMTAIAATIPCCSPWVCLGMFPGIWCMIILSRGPKEPG